MKSIGKVIVLIGICIVAGIGCSAIRYVTNDTKAVSNQCIVPDSKTAIRIAEAVLSARYGKNLILSERPFTAVASNGVWFVEGTFPWTAHFVGWRGGVASVEIKMDDGQILHIQHGK